MSRRPSSSSSVKPRAAALSAPSLARRSAPTRPTRTSRPCNPRRSRPSASATSKKSPDESALEEQRSEKYRHALIAVVGIGLRAGQPGGADAWLSSHLVVMHEYAGRDQTC